MDDPILMELVMGMLMGMPMVPMKDYLTDLMMVSMLEMRLVKSTEPVLVELMVCHSVID